MEYVRNHLNPALIIKRFKPRKNDVELYFPDHINGYDSKKKPPVIKLNKESFFNENGSLLFTDHIYTNTKEDCFIKEKLYFLEQEFLNELIYATNDADTIKFLQEKKEISLEKSFGDYETRVSLVFDKSLSDNFVNLNAHDKKTILKFWDSSHLRPLKYKKFKEFLNHEPVDPIADLLSSRHFLSINFRELFRNKEFEEVVIFMIAYVDFFDRIVLNPQSSISNNLESINAIDTLRTTLYQIPLLFHTIKNEEDLVDKNGNDIIVDSNLIYIKSSNSKFILGDNTVTTIYKNNNLNVIEHINNYLINNNIIDQHHNKLSIMVVSPNNIIIKTDEPINIDNLNVEDNFVKLINSIILFNTDEWIVSQEILSSVTDSVDINIFNTIKNYDFFENDTLNFLTSFNYDVGIKNKFKTFNENYLDNLCISISNEIDTRYNNDIEQYVIFSNLIDIESTIELNTLNHTDSMLLEYLFIRVRIAINNKLGLNLDWCISIGEITEIDGDKFEYLHYHLGDFNKDKEYNILVVYLLPNN